MGEPGYRSYRRFALYKERAPKHVGHRFHVVVEEMQVVVMIEDISFHSDAYVLCMKCNKVILSYIVIYDGNRQVFLETNGG